MSSCCGLEVRVPFCDYRIVEYLYGVPWAFMDHKGREKGLLRHAVRDILPDAILFRKKSPYPKTHHPDYAEAVIKRLEAVLEDAQAPLFALIDRSAVLRMLEGDFTTPWYGQLMQLPQTIVYLLQINAWMKNYSVQIR
jgi:asparagine synthase (glutamine-hydrolysing)